MTSPTRPAIAFAMDQIAGHVTNYRNMRAAIETDPSLEIDARWIEVEYHSPGGRLEKIADTLRVLPSYPFGVSRGALEMRRGLTQHDDADAIFTNASVALFFCRRFRNTATLYDFDSTPIQLDRMESYTPSQDPAPIARLKFKLQQRLFQDATRLQAWSNWAKQSVVDDYGIDGDKIVVNPPGIDLSKWGRVERTSHSDEDRPARVLFVGADFDRKGGPDLLSWFRDRDPADFQLDIVTRDDVAASGHARVHRGLQPNDSKLVELYQRADVFVLPSRGECFGIAAIEAMATGLPVVQSLVGGSGDIVDDGASGFLVPAEDSTALGSAIEATVADPSRWSAMSERSHQIACEKFDLATNTRRTVDQLVELSSN